jgi:hypothetical protein
LVGVGGLFGKENLDLSAKYLHAKINVYADKVQIKCR